MVTHIARAGTRKSDAVGPYAAAAADRLAAQRSVGSLN